MRFVPLFFLFLFLGKPSVHSQEKKEYDAVFEEQLLNVQYPGEQYIKTGEYLLKVSNTNFQKAQAYFLIAQGQNQIGDIEKSIENLFLAKQISDTENYTFLSTYAEIILTRYCMGLGIYDKAQFYLKEAKNKAESIKDARESTIIQSLILEDESRELIFKGDFSQAIILLKKQENLCLDNKIPEIFLTTNKNLLGFCYLKSNQNDLAEHYFNLNLTVLSKNNISSSCSIKYAHYGLACIYLLKSNEFAYNYLELIKNEPVCKPNYELIWIKELQTILKKKKLLKELAYYEEKFRKFEIFEIEKRRIGRSIMLSQIEKDAESTNGITKILGSKGILFLSILLILIIIVYFYNAYKFKKEYLQFKKIMTQSLPENKGSEYMKVSISHSKSDAESLDELAINEKTKNSILQKLKSFEDSKLFLNPDISLEKLSKITEVNTKYLREIIKNYKSKNYSSYINELRINFVIDLLKNDPEYLKYKVSYLAEISGFSSHSTFTVVFRSVTGLSPNQFIDFLKKEKNIKN